MAKGKLNPKQERFVAEYLLDLNATQASIRAGYSAKTAHVQGPRLLGNVAVASEIAKRQVKLADKYEVSAERVIRELALIGFANMLDYVSVKGEGAFVDLSTMTRDQAAAIQEVTAETLGSGGEDGPAIVRTKIKLASKQAALESLGKHLGLFKEQLEVNFTDDFAKMMEQASRRAKTATQDALH